MEEHNRIIAIVSALTAMTDSKFQRDTYDCTVKCPSMTS